MAYTNNPKMGKVRKEAVRLVKYKHWSIRKVAKYYGYNPSTISRWCKIDVTGGWYDIPTKSSRPHRSPRALPRGIVIAIIDKRIKNRRCGQVIQQELKRDGISVSLSSVQRTLERTQLLKKRSVWKRPHDYTQRPIPAHPGALLELDTIHIRTPDGGRLYIYLIMAQNLVSASLMDCLVSKLNTAMHGYGRKMIRRILKDLIVLFRKSV